jgi:hypothetical protein
MKARRRPAKIKQAASKRALWRLQADELRRQALADQERQAWAAESRRESLALARAHHEAWP